MSESLPESPDTRMIRILVLLLILVTGSVAIWYTLTVEPMGIEERFSSALGIAHTEEQDHDEGAGFSLEGSPILYVSVFALICGACWLLYRKFGV